MTGGSRGPRGSWLISALFFLGAIALLPAAYDLARAVPAMTVRPAHFGPRPRFAVQRREVVLWSVIGFANSGDKWMAPQEGLL